MAFKGRFGEIHVQPWKSGQNERFLSFTLQPLWALRHCAVVAG